MRRSLPLLALLLAGCSGDERPATTAATPAPTATATATPTATPAPQRAGKPVTFRSGDGRRVRGVLGRAGAGAPALILLHERGGDLTQWDELAPVLQRAGYTTLAYDDRGDLDETKLVGDLEAAVRYVRRGRPRLPVGVIGASIGASTAVYAVAHPLRRQLDAVVALSPADSAEFIALQTDGRYRPHDVLFISDRSESITAENLLPDARRSKHLVTEENGHGVALLTDPAVPRAILRWLDARLR